MLELVIGSSCNTGLSKKELILLEIKRPHNFYSCEVFFLGVVSI